MSPTRGRTKSNSTRRDLEELAETLRPDVTRPKAISELELYERLGARLLREKVNAA